MRIIVYWDQYSGPLIHGKLPFLYDLSMYNRGVLSFGFKVLVQPKQSKSPRRSRFGGENNDTAGLAVAPYVDLGLRVTRTPD